MAEQQMQKMLQNGEMSQELAQELFENGAVLVLRDFPERCEFGVDYRAWIVGPKFLGLKMIPPGIHFIYISVPGSPRIAFFHDFRPKEVILRKWDKQKEDLADYVSNDVELERVRLNLKNLDRHLGVYPYADFRQWVSLSSHITAKTIERISPTNPLRRISAQTELTTKETELEKQLGDPFGLSIVNRKHRGRIRFTDPNGLPLMEEKEEAKLRFSIIPQITLGDTNVKKAGVDSSERFLQILDTLKGDYRELLGEFQFAFVVFLIGQVHEGFDQWKRIIHLICSCTSVLQSHTPFFIELLTVLHFQMKIVPDDFFEDELAMNNFLATTLSMLFANIEDTPAVDRTLKMKASKFKLLLEKRFNRRFEF